jgi:hypothetical protein
MRVINCDEHIQISDLLVKLNDSLELYFAYSPGRLAWFYYRLGGPVIYSFLNGEDDYFNESD